MNLPYASQVFILFSGPYYTCQNGGDFFSANNDAVVSYIEPNQSTLSLSKSRTCNSLAIALC